MKTFLLGCFICFLPFSFVKAQTATEVEEEKAIRAVMQAQQADWNKGDLEGFMEGYWKSDSLKFYSSRGVTYGWEKTLENYKKGYPSKAHTGKLEFKINDISKINEGAYFLMGEYHLTREVGDANGVFLVIFKKINGKWKIIADMSS
ncbi:MAG: DUF4440 domain-containing protein [Flavobacteriaceae bacterium]